MTPSPRVELFCETYDEINGVALTARQLVAYAKRRDLPLLAIHGGKQPGAWDEGSVRRVALSTPGAVWGSNATSNTISSFGAITVASGRNCNCSGPTSFTSPVPGNWGNSARTFRAGCLFHWWLRGTRIFTSSRPGDSRS
jgi:hypothetical protein